MLGYFRNLTERETINSLFIYNFIKNSDTYLYKDIIFPQRITSYSFFSDLFNYYGDSYLNEYNSIVEEYHKKLLLSKKGSLESINIISILLRYCKYDIVIEYYKEFNITEISYIEFRLLYVARLEYSIYNNMNLSLDDIVKFIQTKYKNMSEFDFLNLISLSTVFKYRYKSSINDQNLKKLNLYMVEAKKLLYIHYMNKDLDSVLKIEDPIFISVMLRGICMNYGLYNNEEVGSILNLASNVAMMKFKSNYMYDLVHRENIVTLNQTMSKFYVNIENYELALKSIHMMIKTDPNDNTGYIEEGMFYMRLNKHLDAINSFEKSIEYGKTSLGISYYFLALCQYEKGIDPEYSLLCSIKYDDSAISSYMALLDLYHSKNNIQEYNRIATSIFNQESVYSKLENKEKVIIDNIISSMK